MFILNGKNEDKTFSRKTVTIYQIEIFEYKNLNKYIEYNETGISKPISDINYEGVTSYYDVINLNNK